MNWLTRGLASWGLGWFTASLFTFSQNPDGGLLVCVLWLALLATAGSWHLLGLIGEEGVECPSRLDS